MSESRQVFACVDCEQVYFTARSLASHRRKHSDPTWCPVCRKPVRYLMPHVTKHIEKDGWGPAVRALVRSYEQTWEARRAPED